MKQITVYVHETDDATMDMLARLQLVPYSNRCELCGGSAEIYDVKLVRTMGQQWQLLCYHCRGIVAANMLNAWRDIVHSSKKKRKAKT